MVSHADGVDPVGACVGPRGSRVRMVVSELRGEKIDIIPFNDEPARFVAKALSPARVREVLVDDDNKQATVVVPDDQLSLAIGKEGQNARLAARLTGWRVDIKSETEFAEEEAELGLEPGGGRHRPLPRDPQHGQAVPERGAAGLALLRPARAPGARRGQEQRGEPPCRPAERRERREEPRRRAAPRQPASRRPPPPRSRSPRSAAAQPTDGARRGRRADGAAMPAEAARGRARRAPRATAERRGG